MLQQMLELSRSPELELPVQEKITRKIALCHRLQNFFQENKGVASLQSFEYLSTALMISAKLFENEEDVKSFKKHSKVCDQSTAFLKAVELKILNRYSWNVDHACLVDFGLNFVANFLLRPADLLHFGEPRGDAPFDVCAHFERSCGPLPAGLRELLAGDCGVQVSVCRAGALSREKQTSILFPLLNSFKNCFLKLLREVCFKSNLKGFLVVFLVLQLKEFLLGADFHVFALFRRTLCRALGR